MHTTLDRFESPGELPWAQSNPDVCIGGWKTDLFGETFYLEKSYMINESCIPSSRPYC